MADPRNPFGFLSEEQIRTQGWASRDEFDEAARQYISTFGLDDAMSLPSEFFTKDAVSNTLKKKPEPAVIPFAPQPTTPPETPAFAPPVPPRMFEPRKPDETQERLREAARGFVAREEEKALAEGTALTPGERSAVAEYTAKEVAKQRDIGGAPSYSVLAETAKALGLDTLFPKIVQSLEPQPIMSDKQVAEYDQALKAKQAQAEAAFSNYYDQNAKEFQGVLDKNVFMSRAKDQLDDFKFYSDLPGSFYGPDVVGPFLLQEELTGNGWSPEYAEAYERTFITGDRPQNPETGLLSVPDESGRLVESSLGATLRGLVLGETLIGAAGQQIGGALASAIKGEGLTTKKGFEDLVAERVAKGQGLEKTATEIAEIYGIEEGTPASDYAWWLGLASGFFLPIDAGVTDAVKTAGRLAGRSETLANVGTKVAEKLGLAATENPIQVLKAVVATGGEAEAAIKKGLAEGVDIRTLAVDNANLIQEVNNVSRVITNIDREALSLARSGDELQVVLKEAAQASKVPYNDFIKTAKGLGLDEFVPAGTAKTALPISDSPRGWLNFIDELSNRAAANTGRLADRTELLSREIVKGRLDKAVAEGKLPSPELVMITPTVALAKDQVAPFLKRLREEPVMDVLTKLSNQTGSRITLEAEDLRIIKEAVGGRQVELVGVPAELRRDLAQARVGEAVAGPGTKVLLTEKPVEIRRDTLNTIIDRVVSKFAAQEGTGLTLSQMGTIAKETERIGEAAVPRIEKFNAALTRIRLSEAFTPVSTRPTGFLKLYNDFVRPAIDTYTIYKVRDFVVSPEEAFAKSNIISALAGIPDGYKLDYDNYFAEARRQGLSGEAAHDYAFSETINRPFTDPDDLFANFYAAYYGGYDSVMELDVLRSGANVSALQGKQDLIKLFTKALQYATLPAEAAEPAIIQIARIYKSQVSSVDRMKVLSLGAKLMESRPLSSFIDSPVWLKRDKPLIDRMGSQRPQFSQANAKVPMFAAYLQQERANRVTQIAFSLRATDAITKKVSFSTAIVNAAQALSKDIAVSLDRFYEIKDPKFIRALEELIIEPVGSGIIDNLSTRNFPLTTPNTAYVAKFYPEIIDLLNKAIRDGEVAVRPLPKGMSQTVADLALANSIFGKFGFTPTLNLKNPSASVKSIANGKVKLTKSSIPNYSDEAVDLIVSSYSPALTQDQLKSWISALAFSNKQFGKKSAEAAKLQRVTAAAETALNGLYNVGDMKATIRRSASLRSVEEAFTAFDRLRDSRLLDGLTDDEKLIVANTLGNATADFTQRLNDAINSIPVKELPVDKLKVMLAQTGYSNSTFWFETVPSFVKQSILGGSIVPNVIYHFQNFITAPLILAINSNKQMGKRFILEFLSDYNIFSKRTITTPTGKVYTYKEIEDLSSNLGLTSSSIQKAEISKNLLRDLINYAGSIGPGGALGTYEMRKGFFSNILKGIGLGDFSIWSQFSNNIDMAFRRKVVAKALEEGRTEAEAVAAGRKALFDYDDLTEIERNIAAKYIWFYRFMRQNLVQTTVAFLDNPAKVARLAKLSKIQSAKAFDMATGGNGELHPDLASYKETRSFIALIDGMDKERLALYSPPMPILEATSQLINGAAFFGLVATEIDALAGLAEPTDPVSREKIIERFLEDYSLSGPAIEGIKLGIARSLGIQVTGFEKEPIIYLDPRFVAMAKTTGDWDTLMAHFEIEMDARDPRAGITTFDGYYYRLGKSESNRTRWQLFMNAVQVAGVSRVIRDYAVILPYLDKTPGMEAGTEITTRDPVLDALKFLGVFNVSAQPTPEAAQQNVRRELIRSLEERSK